MVSLTSVAIYAVLVSISFNLVESLEPASGVLVQCLKEGTMIASMNLRAFPLVDVSRLHLNEASCGYTTLQANQAVFRIAGLTCGTTAEKQGPYILYRNTIIGRVPNDVAAIRQNDVKISFYCRYKREDIHIDVNPGGIIAPTVSSTNGVEGSFSLRMDHYNASSYPINFKTSVMPYHYTLGQRLHFQVNLNTTNSSLVMFIDKCKATPGQADASPEFFFLNKGCAGINDTSTQYIHSRHQPVQRFSTETSGFSILGQKNAYVHCFVKVCPNSTTPSNCDLNNCADAKLLTVGPFALKVEDTNVKKGKSAAQKSDIVIPVTSAAVVVVVVGAGAGAAILIYRHHVSMASNLV